MFAGGKKATLLTKKDFNHLNWNIFFHINFHPGQHSEKAEKHILNILSQICTNKIQTLNILI